MLRTSAATVSEGMLANTADTGSLEYNTVDGTLWFVHARRPARRRHRRRRPRRASSPRCSSRSWTHHLDGTRFGIGVDPADGLLRQGADGWALTWMDARIDGVPVTPRAGKPVEVNALWLRALDVAAAAHRRRRVRDALHLAARARGVVVRRPLRPARRRRPLRRRRRPRGRRRRPCVRTSCSQSRSRTGRSTPATARRVVAVCSRSLLTPLGLRSLAPDDPALPPLPPRRPGRARRRLPPGHGLAVAARALRRRRARRRAARSTALLAGIEAPSRRVGPRLGLRDRRRRRAARRDRLPLPGVVGRRGAARPPRAATRGRAAREAAGGSGRGRCGLAACRPKG